jgi:hypothetical protein
MKVLLFDLNRMFIIKIYFLFGHALAYISVKSEYDKTY